MCDCGDISDRLVDLEDDVKAIKKIATTWDRAGNLIAVLVIIYVGIEVIKFIYNLIF